MSDPKETGPVFILGMSQRTGTNLLWDLIQLHPDCTSAGVIWEDFLATHADLLVKYATEVTAHWDPAWGIDLEQGSDSICRHLGEGLISFLELQQRDSHVLNQGASAAKQNPRRIVTKTPSVRHLRYFFRIFPSAQLLILVRDGRAVVESAVRSFHRDYEQAMRHWASSARTIVEFQQATTCYKPQYLMIKYEDLWTQRTHELRRIFSFLNLPVQSYDFAAAENVAIRGSSTLLREKVEVHWNPVQKSSDFNPLHRWAHWDRRLHERFNWLAGDYLERFGYKQKTYDQHRLAWILWNKMLDARFSAKCYWNDPDSFLSRLWNFWAAPLKRLRSEES